MTCPVVCERGVGACSAPSHGGGQTVRFLNASIFHMLLAETPWTVDYDACDSDQGCMMCGRHFVAACMIVLRKQAPTSRASIRFITERLMQYFVERVAEASSPGISKWISVSENMQSTLANARRSFSSFDPVQRLTKRATNKAIGRVFGGAIPT